MPLQTVHVRVNDAATGQPTPVRLRVTGPDGTYYPPFGHSSDFAIGRGEDVGGNVMVGTERWAFIDGTCEIALPPGAITVEARKGPEYRPLRETVQLPAGKLALRFAVERHCDWRREGWHSGDMRAHFVPPHAALLEAGAEDLAVVNLLAMETQVPSFADGQTHTAYPNLDAFSGQTPCLERDGHLVAVNTHNVHPVLGSLGLLHCHRVVYPLTFGGPGGTDDWSLADWCDQCHRKKGLVVWTQAFRQSVGFTGEELADLVLGKVDAFEIDTVNWLETFQGWYGLLNAGFHVPLVGASAKTRNRTLLGQWRTYAQLPAGVPLSYTAWIESVRAGRTFVTAGPLIRFAVEGAGPGGTVDVRSADQPLQVVAEAESIEPFERLEVLMNGTVVGSSTGPSLRTDVPAAEGGWLAARCVALPTSGYAHTSAVTVTVAGKCRPADPAALKTIVGRLDRTRDWVEHEGRFESDRRRAQLLGVFDQARQQVLARGG